MTRAQIRRRILQALNESASSPVFWSTGQIDAVIDEAAEVLAEEAEAIKRTALFVLKPGHTYYYTRGIAPDCFLPYRVRADYNNLTLTPVTMRQLDAQNETWGTVSGTPEVWFGVSWDLFGIYPKAAAGGGQMRMDYIAWPRALASDDDVPEFSEADQDGLVLYGVYDGLLKQWDMARAMQAFSLFMEQWGRSQDRHGVGTMQARSWQIGHTNGSAYPHGMER